MKKFCAVNGDQKLDINYDKPWTLEQAISAKKPSDHSTLYASEKLGEEASNKKVLVANIAENNSSWWASVFDTNKDSNTNKLKGKESSQLEAITQGYSTDTIHATTFLNQVCDTAYKAAKDSFSKTGTENDHKYYKDVKKFCTVSETTELAVS